MRISPAIFALVLEITFIVYCIHMTYLLDIQDPLPREWMFPNFLIGAAILVFGLFIAVRLYRDQTAISNRQ
jgi:multisubunit Na+/H+ antiporter MnhC subunit